MSLTGIDIAWARPSISDIKATGAHWVARYLSNDPTKNWTASEVKEYPANGLACVVVWETTTTRATDGRAAGVADAQTADSQRAAVGFPADMPIYFAVDEDTDWTSVQDYAQGFIDVLGIHRVGVYGGYRIIEGAHAYGIPFLWQTVAWSGGQRSAHASIYQPADTTLNGDADFDYAEVADFGQFPRPASTTGDWFDVSPIPASDLAQIADAVAAKLTDGPHRDSLAAANLYWLERALDPTRPLDPKDTSWPVQQTLSLRSVFEAQAKEQAAVKSELDALKAAVAEATTALATLAADQNVTAAAVQQGLTSELNKLGQVLGGLK